MPATFQDPEALVDHVLQRTDRVVRLAIPLGIGKPNHFVNALYSRARGDPGIALTIYTALTLARPQPHSLLEARLMEPIGERLFGNCPDLEYEQDRLAGRLPANVRLHEFYFAAGSRLTDDRAQRDYLASNYTHVARDLARRGINVIAQQVARPEHGSGGDAVGLSLACNPDTSLDLADLLEQEGSPCLRVAEVNSELPFMRGDAEVPSDWFDAVLQHESLDHTLFGPPKTAVPAIDHAIGLQVSALVRDGGDLQIGIGSLGDALVHALIVRQTDNDVYQLALRELGAPAGEGTLVAAEGGLAPFVRGLHADTEMFVDGLMYLVQSGILKKRVYGHPRLQALLNEGAMSETVNVDTVRTLRDRGVIAGQLRVEDVELLSRFGILRAGIRLDGTELVDEEHARWPARVDDEALARHAPGWLGERLRGGAIINAGFFLGPQAFYAWLRALDDETRDAIHMNRISRINQLFGHEALDRAQRKDARFVNTCMKMTLSGAAVSDGLEDGRVVSGVGGQYNFVAMAHELRGARSILQLRSTRRNADGVVSNIVPSYGHTTIPRHLRDLVVTE